MKLKRAGVANKGAEELAQYQLKVLTRARAQAEAETLFSEANSAKAKEQRKIRGLFVQAQGAETMAPQLTKTSSVRARAQSVTANVDAFFEKLSEARKSDAQRRYPELMKVSTAPGIGTRPSPTLKRSVSAGNSSTKGELPSRSMLSGGAA